MVKAFEPIFWLVIMTGLLILFDAPTWGWLGFAFVLSYSIAERVNA